MWFSIIVNFELVDKDKIVIKVNFHNQKTYLTDQVLCECGAYNLLFIVVEADKYFLFWGIQ